jgi:hypothetical protein
MIPPPRNQRPTAVPLSGSIARSTTRGEWLAAIFVLFASSTMACKDASKVSAQKAAQHAALLADLATRDVGEVERGLPQGAVEMAKRAYAKGADPRQDVNGVRGALKRVRAEVPDLTVAKSTFFALADDKGVAIRNDLEEDVMAGQNVVTIFPELKKALDGSFVTTSGVFPGPPSPRGPDRDWMAAAPVKDESGKVEGLLLTGWTYRRFANHLQESLRHDLAQEALDAGDTGKLPILYVAVFDKTGVYAAPLTPPVNEKALADADLVAKTASGPSQGTMSITDRDFGYGAARVPKLGPDTGVVVLRSEI